MPEGDFITGPRGGNARFECEMIALQPETEGPLESRAVEPAGRSARILSMTLPSLITEMIFI